MIFSFPSAVCYWLCFGWFWNGWLILWYLIPPITKFKRANHSSSFIEQPTSHQYILWKRKEKPCWKMCSLPLLALFCCCTECSSVRIFILSVIHKVWEFLKCHKFFCSINSLITITFVHSKVISLRPSQKMSSRSCF